MMTARAATVNVRPNDAAVMVSILLVSIATGAALTVAPMLALVPIGALASLPLLVSGRVRIVFLVLGGLFIFQRDQGLSASKMAFLALFAVAFVGASVNVHSLRDSLAYRVARPLLTASAVFTALLAL